MTASRSTSAIPRRESHQARTAASRLSPAAKKAAPRKKAVPSQTEQLLKLVVQALDAKKAEANGISVKFWDFLFYASFGFVVTSSVSIAGVLLVFCYLIVPSVAAMLYATRIGPRLAIGWTMGTLVCACEACRDAALAYGIPFISGKAQSVRSSRSWPGSSSSPSTRSRR